MPRVVSLAAYQFGSNHVLAGHDTGTVGADRSSSSSSSTSLPLNLTPVANKRTDPTITASH